MDGKVEVSILQWESQRKELEGLKEVVERYKESAKQVKLTLIEKRSGGHYQYNRYNDRNDFVKDEQTVERVEYIGLEDIKRIMKEEAQDEVSEDLTKLTLDKNNLNSEIRRLKETNDKEVRTVKETLNKKIDKLIESHKMEVEEMIEDRNEGMKMLEDDKIKLQKIIDGVELEKEEESKDDIIENLNRIISELSTKLDSAKGRVPWWKR